MSARALLGLALLVASAPAEPVAQRAEANAPDRAEDSDPSVPHRLIDMVVAQVDSTVITYSELAAETRLVLLRTGGPELARAGTLSQSLLSAVLRSMVVRELILGEVRRLKLRDVADADVKKAVSLVRERFVADPDYQRFLEKSGFGEPGSMVSGDLDAPPALVAVLKAELSVERFIEVRTRRSVVVRESELVRCYEFNRSAFGDRTYADVRAELRLRLEEQARERSLEALIDQLERRANIRYTPSFEPPVRRLEDAATVGISCPEPRQAEAP